MRAFFLAVTVAVLCGSASAQINLQTVGLISHSAGSLDSGYVLFAPLANSTTYLIDKCGMVIHSWKSNFVPGESAYLRPDGKLVRAGVLDGGSSKQGSSCCEMYDWDGTLLWSYTLDSAFGQHHDFEIMPNGNVLVISHELIDSASLIAAGRDPSLVRGQFVSERLVELRPVGTNGAEIVWQWRPFDHLVQDFDATKANYGRVEDHPELIDVNYPNARVGEWLHFNSVRYNAKFDQILVSAHNASEVWIIDHSTTTAQAATHAGGTRGKGGDLLYRWGNPAAYRHGTAANQVLFGQHECLWIADGRPQAGSIMVFNNGTGRPAGMFATVDVFTPPVDADGNYNTSSMPYLPASLDWSWQETPPDNLFTQTAGGGEMLSNGNVLVCSGQMGTIFELDSTRTTKVWEYVNPVNSAGPMTQGVVPSGNYVYKTVFYPYSYPAFDGKTLNPGPPIELGPVQYACSLDVKIVSVAEPANAPAENSVFVFPNPAHDRVTIAGAGGPGTVVLYDALGRQVAHGVEGVMETDMLPAGVYTAVVKRGRSVVSKMLSIAR